MCRRSGTRGNPPPHRHHPSSHAPSPHSSSIAERNQSRLRLFSEATTKSAATTPAPAAAGKNTRSATGREEAGLTKGVELRRRHDATGRHCYRPASHLTTHSSNTAPKRRNAVARGRQQLLRYGRRHGEHLTPHPFQPS